MIRRHAAALLIAAWAPSAARADGISLDSICVATTPGETPRFAPQQLLDAVLDISGPSRHALRNGGADQPTYEDEVDVIVRDACSRDAAVCKDGDSAKIAGAQIILRAMFHRTDIVISRLRDPSAAEEADEPWLAVARGQGDPGSIAELLDRRQRFLKVDCGPGASHGGAPGTGDPAGNDGSSRQGIDWNKVRVTSKLEDLTIERTKAGLKSVDFATASIASDHVGKKITFDLDAILGYYVPIGRSSGMVPFAQVQRTSVTDTSVNPHEHSKSVNKIAFGSDFTFQVPDLAVADFAPIYIVDHLEGSKVVSAKLNFIPGFLRVPEALPIGRPRPILGDLLYLRLIPRVLVQGSKVVDSGTNAELADTSSYLRGGIDLSWDFWGTGPLEHLGASFSYKGLWKVTSGPRNVHMVKGSLLYWLAGDNVSFGYTYENGRDEDTTKKVDDWKLSLGVRF